MRIRRIKVRNYAGIAEAEVMFPDTGITIIVGDNEVGKTSMIEAVDMILRFVDTSSAGPVKGAMTVGTDIGPEVEVDIVAGAYEFTYTRGGCVTRRRCSPCHGPRPINWQEGKPMTG
jgi:hypothetical protein